MDKEALWKTIKNTGELSLLPTVYFKISKLIDDPKTSAATLASVISRDQTLTAKLLKVANSPFYSVSPLKITSITYAIARIGFEATKNLVLTTSIFDVFSDFQEDFKPAVRGFWQHSIGCAVGSKVIAEYIHYPDPEEMFVTGLLHDIGKIMEIQFMPKEFIKILKLVNNHKVSIREAEEQVFGYTHTYTGKLLSKEWKLAPHIVDSIELHHIPAAATQYQKQVSVVHIADIFSHALDLGSGGSNRIPTLSEQAWELIQIKTSMIDTILRKIKKEWKNAVSLLFPPKNE